MFLQAGIATGMAVSSFLGQRKTRRKERKLLRRQKSEFGLLQQEALDIEAKSDMESLISEKRIAEKRKRNKRGLNSGFLGSSNTSSTLG